MIQFAIRREGDDPHRALFRRWLQNLATWIHLRSAAIPSASRIWQWRRGAFLCTACDTLGTPNSIAHSGDGLMVGVICPCGEKWSVTDGN